VHGVGAASPAFRISREAVLLAGLRGCVLAQTRPSAPLAFCCKHGQTAFARWRWRRVGGPAVFAIGRASHDSPFSLAVAVRGVRTTGSPSFPRLFPLSICCLTAAEPAGRGHRAGGGKLWYSLFPGVTRLHASCLAAYLQLFLPAAVPLLPVHFHRRFIVVCLYRCGRPAPTILQTCLDAH